MDYGLSKTQKNIHISEKSVSNLKEKKIAECGVINFSVNYL